MYFDSVVTGIEIFQTRPAELRGPGASKIPCVALEKLLLFARKQSSRKQSDMEEISNDEANIDETIDVSEQTDIEDLEVAPEPDNSPKRFKLTSPSRDSAR